MLWFSNQLLSVRTIYREIILDHFLWEFFYLCVRCLILFYKHFLYILLPGSSFINVSCMYNFWDIGATCFCRILSCYCLVGSIFFPKILTWVNFFLTYPWNGLFYFVYRSFVYFSTSYSKQKSLKVQFCYYSMRMYWQSNRFLFNCYGIRLLVHLSVFEKVTNNITCYYVGETY